MLLSRFALFLWSGLFTGKCTRAASSQAAFLSSNATALREHALQLMDESPLIDTHVDLPQILRSLDKVPLNAVDLLEGHVPGHTDIRRMKKGHLGAAFLSVWAPCSDLIGVDIGPDFLNPDNSVRDALEMFDLVQQMTSRFANQVSPAYTSSDILQNHEKGKLSFLIGIEGAHMLGNSLSTLRMYAQLGARYLTLTHTCHNAFASSAGAGSPMTAVHQGNGLSPIGRDLIRELNRLGMIVDLSHVSDQVMAQALELSLAPVMFSHSGARAIHSHPRNVPDDILKRIGSQPDQNPGVVLSVFYPPFIGPTAGGAKPDVVDVADHIEHIASVTGRGHVGIASDFDGMYDSVVGLETAEDYPNLVMELLHRGWSDHEIKGVMGLNLLRVMDEVDRVKSELSQMEPSRAIYEKRKDLPAKWGGEEDAYLPTEVKEYLRGRMRDEL